MTQPTLDTPENWSEASSAYGDRVAPVMMQPFAEAWLDALDPAPVDSALEIGAGTGALTQALWHRVGSLLATDFAPGMVDILRTRMAALGAENTRCEVMDATRLPLDDNSFDCAAAALVMMLIPDKARAFAELNRVVKPGGRVVVSTWTGPDRMGGMSFFGQIVARTFPDMPKPPAPPPIFSLADPGLLSSMMEAAGFSEVTVTEVTREMTVATPDQAWGMISTGAPPAKMMMGAIGDAGRDKLKAEIFRVFEEDHVGGPVTVENTSLVATAKAG